MIVAVAVVVVVILVSLLGQVARGTLGAGAVFPPLAAMITAAGFAMTYLGFREASDDRRLIARPFLWCVCDNAGGTVRLRLENDNEHPALRIRVFIAATLSSDCPESSLPDSPRGEMAPPTHVSAYRRLGAIAPRHVARTPINIHDPTDLHIFVLYSTYLGDAALSRFHYIRRDPVSRMVRDRSADAAESNPDPLELVEADLAPLKRGLVEYVPRLASARKPRSTRATFLHLLHTESDLLNLDPRLQKALEGQLQGLPGIWSEEEGASGWTQRPLAEHDRGGLSPDDLAP